MLPRRPPVKVDPETRWISAARWRTGCPHSTFEDRVQEAARHPRCAQASKKGLPKGIVDGFRRLEYHLETAGCPLLFWNGIDHEQDRDRSQAGPAKGDRPIFADFAAKIGTVPENGYTRTSLTWPW